MRLLGKKHVIFAQVVQKMFLRLQTYLLILKIRYAIETFPMCVRLGPQRVTNSFSGPNPAISPLQLCVVFVQLTVVAIFIKFRLVLTEILRILSVKS
jgi:hypothetical protein